MTPNTEVGQYKFFHRIQKVLYLLGQYLPVLNVCALISGSPVPGVHVGLFIDVHCLGRTSWWTCGRPTRKANCVEVLPPGELRLGPLRSSGRWR